jgi:hypothetical protein
MPKVNHFTARGLNNSAHDVYGGIVAIKKAGSRYNAHFIFWNVWGWILHDDKCYIGGGQIYLLDCVGLKQKTPPNGGV